jgi:hypothetical protein
VKPNIEKIISGYQLIESIKNGKFRRDNFNNEVISQEEFQNWIGGINLKNILNNNESLEKRRFKIEEYYKVTKIKQVI